MSDRVQAEIVHGDAAEVEVVREGDPEVEKPDVGSSLDAFVASRKAEHPEWYQDDEEGTVEPQQAAEDEQAGSEDPPVQEEDQEETEELEVAKHDSEPESKALKRILQRETRLREDKAAFEAEQKDFREKLARWEEEKRLASIDPVAYLKTLDIPQEKLIDFAKAAYYESLGDAAPDEYRGQKESLALRREIEQLKARLEAKEQPPQDNEVNERALLAYQESMLEATKTFDAEQFPSVARVVEAYSEADVAADMFKVAQQYAERMGGEGAALTPEQCMAEVEKHYEQLLGKLLPAEQKVEAAAERPVRKAAKKTLSNSMSSNVPPEKPLDGLSYEEVAARSRERFFKAMKGE